MTRGVTDATATLLRDGRVLVAGLDGTELYDPASGDLVGYFEDDHTALQPHGDAAARWQGARGRRRRRARPAVDSAELYDPETGSWTATASLRATGNTRFDRITATLLQDGTVLVVRPTTAELYDPATGTWTATGEQPRHVTAYPSATLLSDGMVLVIWHGDAAPGSTTTELYDPSTGLWTPTASTLLRHEFTPAILLRDGTVLIAGGHGAMGAAELYFPARVSPPPGSGSPMSPTPTTIPTLATIPIPPQAGPIPPGARPWQVVVVNESSQPTTLFVARSYASGMAWLVGSVTPNVVPPGTSVEVTFLLPAEEVTGWRIFVNPGPDTAALLSWDEVPRAGELLITADGQTHWLGR